MAVLRRRSVTAATAGSTSPASAPASTQSSPFPAKPTSSMPRKAARPLPGEPSSQPFVPPSFLPPPLPPPPGIQLDKEIIDILEQEVPQQYRALYEFTPVQADDLFLSKNEIVYVVLARDDGWCQGMNVHGVTPQIATHAHVVAVCYADTHSAVTLHNTCPQLLQLIALGVALLFCL